MGMNKNVWVLTISVFFLAISYTMLVPFLPMYLLELGAPEEDVAMWSGAVFSVTFLVAAVMAPIWGRLADQKGRKLMALRAGVSLAICYMAIGFISEPWHLFLGRAFLGFSNGFMPSGMTLVSMSVPKEDVGKAIGIYQTGNIVGSIVGPLVGGFVGEWFGMRPAFIIAGLVLAFITVLVWVFVQEPVVVRDNQVQEDSKTSLWEDFMSVKENTTAVILLSLMFLVQAIVLMLHPIIALYIAKLQGSLANASFLAGSILSMGGLAGAITVNLWGAWGRRLGYFKIISTTIFGAGSAIFLQYFATDVWMFGLLQVLVGSFMVGILPGLNTAIALATPIDFRGRIFGMSSMAIQLGNAVGPLLSAFITTYIGIQYVFSVTGSLLMLLGVYISKRYISRDKELMI